MLLGPCDRRIDINAGTIVRRFGLGHEEERDENSCYDGAGRDVACEICCDGSGANCCDNDLWSVEVVSLYIILLVCFFNVVFLVFVSDMSGVGGGGEKGGVGGLNTYSPLLPSASLLTSSAV